MPRRLASILGVIALHGSRGVSRDRLLELLWTDSDPERGRHALTQSMYALRRLLGRDDAIVGTAQLTFSPEVVSTDVVELERAIGAGDGERVSALYRGPVLDGLVVPGAPELERWLDERRSELRHQVGSALAAAAAAHHDAGRGTAAVALLRRRVALDPLDAAATMALMRGLAAIGDAPGAMQQSRVYAALVRQELDLAPDARVEGLAHELMRQGEARSGAEPVARPTRESWRLPRLLAALAWRPSRETRRTMRQAAVAAVAGLTALLALAHLGDRRARHEPPAASIAVLPFRALGLARDLDHLPAALVELLSVALAERDTTHVVDPAIVHAWWLRRESAPAPADSLVAAASSLGAGQVVTGTVVGDARLLVIRASIRGPDPTGFQVSASVRGPLDSLPELVEELARQLRGDRGVVPAVDRWPPGRDSAIER